MKSYEKYLLIIYTIFNLNFFSYTEFATNKFSNYIKIINIIPVIIYIFHILLIKQKKKGYFSLPISIFIISLICGAIFAFIYYNQSFIQSFTVSTVFFPFFIYLLLVKVNFKHEDILLVIKLMFWLTLIVFSIDFYTYPNTLFAWVSHDIETRGALGIIFYGQGFTILGALIYLESYLSTNKLQKLIPFIIALIFIVFLTGSRTYLFALIASSFFIIIYCLINTNSLRKKSYIISSLFGLFFIGIYFLQSHILNLVDITRDQFSSYSDDIRLECINYFTSTFQKGIFTQLFGNGYPHSESKLGAKLITAESNGYYTSDIGIVGLWAYFGVLSVLAWVLIFIKVFSKRYIRQNIAIVGFFIYIFINSFLTYTLFDPGYIIAYIYALYAYTTRNEKPKYSLLSKK